jgi:hypothetical protein
MRDLPWLLTLKCKACVAVMLPLDEAMLEFLAQPLGTANTFVH